MFKTETFRHRQLQHGDFFPKFFFFFSSLISGDVLHEVFEIQEHFDSS